LNVCGIPNKEDNLLMDEKYDKSQMEAKIKLLEEELTKKDKLIAEKDTFINNIFESITHPFYVIDVYSYKIIMGNSATYLTGFQDGETCHERMHNSKTPCKGVLNPCPIERIKKTRKPVTMIHQHHVKGKGDRIVEVHGYPIFSDSGEIVSMIEYSIDITSRAKGLW